MPSFNAPRTKIQIKLCLTRIKLLIQKQNALAKAQRRAIAQFLEGGKIETATIRTETIINDDLHVELLEVLELYLEVLTARFGLLETQRECDPGISDAVCGIIYAAGRTEMKELHTLREMLMAKFGREFAVAVMDNQDNCVPNRVTSKLITETPSSALVDAYMYEIVKAYGVNFKPESVKEEEDVAASLSKPESVPKALDKTATAAFASTLQNPASDVPKLPNVNPTDPKDMGQTTGSAKEGPGVAATEPSKVPKGGGDDLNDLMKRLEALKKR